MTNHRSSHFNITFTCSTNVPLKLSVIKMFNGPLSVYQTTYSLSNVDLSSHSSLSTSLWYLTPRECHCLRALTHPQIWESNSYCYPWGLAVPCPPVPRPSSSCKTAAWRIPPASPLSCPAQVSRSLNIPAHPLGVSWRLLEETTGFRSYGRFYSWKQGNLTFSLYW